MLHIVLNITLAIVFYSFWRKTKDRDFLWLAWIAGIGLILELINLVVTDIFISVPIQGIITKLFLAADPIMFILIVLILATSSYRKKQRNLMPNRDNDAPVQ